MFEMIKTEIEKLSPRDRLALYMIGSAALLIVVVFSYVHILFGVATLAAILVLTGIILLEI